MTTVDDVLKDWPPLESLSEGSTALKKALRRAIAEAVATKRCDPDQAFGVLMFVACDMVARVEDDGMRKTYVDMVQETFGQLVELSRSGDAVLIEAVKGALIAERKH